MSDILKTFLHRLTNLSSVNRSLFLPRITVDKYLDFKETNFLNGKSGFDVLQDLVAHKRVTLCEVIDTVDSQANEVSRRLKSLNRLQDFIFEERGARDLYLGWPFVRGKFNDDTLVRAPIVFFPVSLQIINNKWECEIRSDVNVTLNKSFLLAYAYYNQESIDEDLLERTLTDFDRDITVFRTQLYDLLKESKLEIHFNQDTFLDGLIPFKNFNKKELEQKEKTGKLKLFSEAVIGIFPQAGSYLVPDYMNLLEEKADDLEKYFGSKIKHNPDDEGRTKYSDRVLEENTYTPFRLDSHQEEALKYIKKGNSVNIQGPPGTGKSQLIANLISDYIARGKNVLLVCQKKVALDVVYGRLEEKGLHDFVGLVHDFKNDRKLLFQKISDQIDQIEEYRSMNNSLDAIHLERVFSQASRRIEQICEELEEYKFSLFDESECGKAVKELYLISNPSSDYIELNQWYSRFNYAQLPEFVRRLERYFTYHEKYEGTKNFWAREQSFAEFGTKDYLLIKEGVKKSHEEFTDLRLSSKEILNSPLDFDSLSFYLQKEDLLNRFAKNLEAERTHKYFRFLLEHPMDEEEAWMAKMEETTMHSFKGVGMESSLSASDLGRFQEALEKAIKARKGPFSWMRWRLFSKDRIFITRVLVANGLRSSKQGFKDLIEKIDNRLNFEHNASLIQQKDWLTDFPPGKKRMEIQNWFFYQRNAIKTLRQYRELRDLDSYVNIKNEDRANLVRRLQRFHQLVETVPPRKLQWKKFLTENQQRTLFGERITLEEVLKQLDRDFENLHDFHSLRESLDHHEMRVIELLKEYEGKRNSKIECFKNSLALAWIEHIESKYPILRTVSSLKFEQNIAELKQCVEQKRQTSEEILLMRCRERTYENLEFNRLNNLVTFRDLQHQVRKKRKIWPLRKVISDFSEELFQLIPCWMASPESASAIFPMKQMFDLVIFDEASQCYAERGIPSIYRGKQVVIAGDLMQLKPYDLYRIRWDSDELEDGPDSEIESLLELSDRYLPKMPLKGHYRSKALELIEFSNVHFYGEQLRVVPDKGSIGIKNEHAIKYIKVDGVWDQNVNKVEAQMVLEIVAGIRKRSPEKSIGIVTFNARQQALIADLLEGNVNMSRLFVKNIENVQGDERDIIIFSTAYAPDKKGKLQLRFGPLNLEGGENRLNVAITRARENIYLVTSLLPSELKVSDTKNEGPKFLKAYLDYAYNVSLGKWKPHIKNPSKSSVDWYLKNKIFGAVNDIDPMQEISQDLPFGDLSVKQGEGYNGLVMTDDDHYYEASSSKEIYIYQDEQLSDKKWPVMRLDSREVWREEAKQMDRLRIFLNSIRRDN